MPSLPLTPPVFAILGAFVEEVAGLSYGPEQRELLAERASVRAQERGLETLLDYYYLLRYDDPQGEEVQALVESLVVHETYLFRELDALVGLADLLAALVRRDGPRVRVWSAACSTGEEPLTLAMLLEERGLADAVEVVATDVSRRAVARARAGRLGRRAVRGGARQELVARWLRQDGEELLVDPALLRRVDFRRVNLLDGPAVAALGTFDAVLCRNVLIYFKDERAREVVARLEARLRPRGVLIVGASESLLRLGSGLVLEEVGGAFVYRKASS